MKVILFGKGIFTNVTELKTRSLRLILALYDWCPCKWRGQNEYNMPCYLLKQRLGGVRNLKDCYNYTGVRRQVVTILELEDR